MTAWGSYGFDDIYAIIKSVGAGTLNSLGEKWRGAADLINQNAENLADETETLHQDWRSPTAADLFQQNVANSVRRMGEWKAAADVKAGRLKQAAGDVLASQSEMDRLRAERDKLLAAAQTEAEKQAIRQEYDQLAREEGRQLGGRLSGLAAWQPPPAYAGLIGLAPEGVNNSNVVFPEELEFDQPQTQAQFVDPSDTEFLPTNDFGDAPDLGSPVPSPLAGAPLLGMPLLTPPLAGGAQPGQPVAGRLAGFGGRAASALNGYSPSGLFGRLAGGSRIAGALAPGTTGATGAGVPMVPPQAGASGALSGRRGARRRPAPQLEPLAQEQAMEQQTPEPAGPAPVSGRPPATGRAATPREVLIGQAETDGQTGVALGQ